MAFRYSGTEALGCFFMADDNNITELEYRYINFDEIPPETDEFILTERRQDNRFLIQFNDNGVIEVREVQNPDSLQVHSREKERYNMTIKSRYHNFRKYWTVELTTDYDKPINGSHISISNGNINYPFSGIIKGKAVYILKDNLKNQTISIDKYLKKIIDVIRK